MNWDDYIFSADIPFGEKVRRIAAYQYEQNPVYRRYCEALSDTGAISEDLLHWQDESAEEHFESSVPLLPVRAFRDADVTVSPGDEHDLIFRSSGTSGMQRSVHRVLDRTLCETSLLKGFRHFYQSGSAVIWGYTPGYADNPDSSLIYMLKTLIGTDDSGLSRFLPLGEPLNEAAIHELEQEGKRLILFGAAFGLLDLLEMEPVTLPPNSTVIETGGMKTHRREITREELHRQLAEGFGLDRSRIHSEYGMAELLSQAYATGGSWFRTVPWMQVSIRNPDHPFETLPPYSEGLIGVIDLANVHSCPFLLTGDRGISDPKGRFKVLGRWNPKDLRGCNFLIEED